MNIRNIKISRRVYLGIGLILAFTIVMGIAMLFQIQRLWDNLDQLYQHPFTVINAVREIKADVLDLNQELSESAILQKIPDETDLGRFKQLDHKIEENLKIISDRYLGKKDDIASLKIEYNRYRLVKDEIIADLVRKNWSHANSFILNDAFQLINRIKYQAASISSFAQKKATVFYENSQGIKSNVSWKTSIYLLFTIFSGGIIALILVISIKKPLLTLQNITRKIAKGDLRQEISISGNDEISDLLMEYCSMQENLLEKASITTKIANGELNEKVKVKDKNDELAISINKIVRNFSLIVDQAERIGKGDFSATIPFRSENDKLGASIYTMVSSLKDVLIQSTMIADGDYSGYLEPKSEFDELARSINKMTKSLREITLENTTQNWLQVGNNELSEKMSGDQDVPTLSSNIIAFLCRYLDKQIGAIYLFDSEENSFKLTGSFAYSHRKGLKNSYKSGEGLIGQAAMEKSLLFIKDLPDDYIHINSGLGDAVPRYIVVAPFVFQDNTIGVIEIASLISFKATEISFIKMILDQVAISFNMALKRNEMQRLLSVLQEQTELLRVKQEEMIQTNEELEQQTKALKRSEEHMQTQQEELRVINEELQANGQNLMLQQEKLVEKNGELEKAQKNIEIKANELERTGKYKSEFLANMSHELRTPLNSLLILSQDLAQNRDGNLSTDQIESSQIIYKSGNDLLNLINEILDLSKIESGKLDLNIKKTELSDVTFSIQRYFKKLMEEKGLGFILDNNQNSAPFIFTDSQRLEQILKNLMSNAIKFTHHGNITFAVESPVKKIKLPSGMSEYQSVAFSVTDTGIGISTEMQLKVFDAFHQGDGSISRRFGGTGLGLSISKELAHMLGGEIYLDSEIDKGSTFTLVLPVQYQKKTEKPWQSEPKGNTLLEKDLFEPKTTFPELQVNDDRENLTISDLSILIIEDDPAFAKVLIDQCHRKNFKCIATPSGEEGLKLTEQFNPAAIILDIRLPGMDGWSVMDALKSNSKTRHIPVHMMSALEKDIEAMQKGAIGFLTKPVKSEELELAFSDIQKFIDRKMKELLIIEDDVNLRRTIRKIVGATDIQINEASTAEEAIKKIQEHRFDCIVLDLGLPDMTGFELLRRLETENTKIPPVIVYTGRDLSQSENEALQQYANSIIIKGVKSEERLLDETALFLHRIIDELPGNQKSTIINLYDKDKIFKDKKILVVDDDMRNVFALTKVLEQSGMNVIKADNGVKALALLSQNTDVNIVLMDIMMPVMDGYEAIKKIREQLIFKKLPIIALTAKAMKDDSAKCIAAGANDYMAKPVNVDKLFSLMRVWLY